MTNPHEEAARARKVDALIQQIDATFMKRGLDPLMHPLVALGAVREIPKTIDDAARALNKSKPSDVTRAAVIAFYEQRASHPPKLSLTSKIKTQLNRIGSAAMQGDHDVAHGDERRLFIDVLRAVAAGQAGAAEAELALKSLDLEFPRRTA